MIKGRRVSHQKFWISGINQSLMTLRSGKIAIDEILLSRTDRRVSEIVELARRLNIPVRREEKKTITSLVGHVHHQGVALRSAVFPYASLDEILGLGMDAREPLVILDSIQDPQNLGGLLRSACFFGVKSVIIPKDRAAKITETVVKVSAGATAHIPVAMVTNLARTLDRLKEAGLWILGLDLQAEKSLYEADLTVPLGLVVGNEQKGIRPLVKKSCDLLVKIPAFGPIESLNAASAGTIALAEVRRQRIVKNREAILRI